MNKYGNPTIKVKMVKKSLKNEWQIFRKQKIKIWYYMDLVMLKKFILSYK